jgi:uncharacterized membrane protein
MMPDESEWLAQEAAAKAERMGSAHELDARSADYLAVARALRQPLAVDLPNDFARRVAVLTTRCRPVVEVESGLERRLLFGLAIGFGIAALVAAIVYGRSWLGGSISLVSQFGKPSMAWVVSLLGCLAISALSQQLARMVGQSGDNSA